MGQNLLVSIVEIEKGREPDWKAMRQYLAALSEDEAEAILAKVCLSEEEASRQKVVAACLDVMSAWTKPRRCYIKLNLAKTDALLAGNTSWGDNVEEVDNLSIFSASGARAAGFIEN